MLSKGCCLAYAPRLQQVNAAKGCSTKVLDRFMMLNTFGQASSFEFRGVNCEFQGVGVK